MRAAVAVALALCLALSAGTPADSAVVGRCHLVAKARGDTLRLAFRLHHAAPNRVWRITFTRDGRRIYQARHRTDAGGGFRVERSYRNTRGTDVIVGSATLLGTSATCRVVIRV